MDNYNLQFTLLSLGEELTPAAPELIAALERLVSGDDQEASSAAPTDGAEPGTRAEGDITDDEINRLLAAIRDIPATYQPDHVTTNKSVSMVVVVFIVF